MSEIAVVPGAVDDVASIAARRGFEEAAYRLALETADAGCAWVARDQGEPVGLALLQPSAEEHYVGDLYVEPSYRGSGLGAQLLDAALEANAGGLTRTIMLAQGDGAAAALALRRGIAIRVPVLHLAGPIPREDVLAQMASGDFRFEIDAIGPGAHAFSLDALDRSVRGTVRPAEHARFAREAAGNAMLRDGEFVAYAYVWPDGRIGPLAAASAVYLVQALALAMLTLERRFGASWCSAFVPATNVRLVRAALRAGLRIEGARLLATDEPEADLARYAGFHPLLF